MSDRSLPTRPIGCAPANVAKRTPVNGSRARLRPARQQAAAVDDRGLPLGAATGQGADVGRDGAGSKRRRRRAARDGTEPGRDEARQSEGMHRVAPDRLPDEDGVRAGQGHRAEEGRTSEGPSAPRPRRRLDRPAGRPAMDAERPAREDRDATAVIDGHGHRPGGNEPRVLRDEGVAVVGERQAVQRRSAGGGDQPEFLTRTAVAVAQQEWRVTRPDLEPRLGDRESPVRPAVDAHVGRKAGVPERQDGGRRDELVGAVAVEIDDVDRVHRCARRRDLGRGEARRHRAPGRQQQAARLGHRPRRGIAAGARASDDPDPPPTGRGAGGASRVEATPGIDVPGTTSSGCPIRRHTPSLSPHAVDRDGRTVPVREDHDLAVPIGVEIGCHGLVDRRLDDHFGTRLVGDRDQPEGLDR